MNQVGNEVIDYIFRADTNIIESSYSDNAEGTVNKVKIYDEENQYLGMVQDADSISLLSYISRSLH